jgi:antitoxin ParD1/3/4
MGITHAPDIETMIKEKVASGLYPNADEMLREALRRLDEHDRLQWLRAANAKGEEGEGEEHTPELMERIYQNAIRRYRAGETPSSDVVP